MGKGYTRSGLRGLRLARQTILNRIVLSLAMIVAASALCEFYWRPASSPAYRAAVLDYSHGEYPKSLAELKETNAFQPNNPSVLALMGWDLLKLGKPRRAEQCFRRARWFEPENPDPLLGDIYAEISLQKYADARRLLQEFERRHGATAGFERADDTLSGQLKLVGRANARSGN